MAGPTAVFKRCVGVLPDVSAGNLLAVLVGLMAVMVYGHYTDSF